jgi:hypothetical protein
MWDHDTLAYLNNQYVTEERKRKKERAATPVEILAEKLLSFAPPSIATLVAALTEQDDFAEFRQLVRTFTPEYERDILHERTPTAQMACFATHFGDRYFPIGGMYAEWETYREFLFRIPCQIRGLSYEDYDTIPDQWKPSYILMAYLVESVRDEEDQRVGLAEACMDIVPRELVDRVPANGLSQELAHKLLDGTRFEGLAVMADYIQNDTGNFFMDTDEEMFYSTGGPDWTKEEVEAAKKEWLEADALDARMDKLAGWLEEDMESHFKELLDFIDERRGIIGGDTNERNGSADEGARSATVGAAGVPSSTAG